MKTVTLTPVTVSAAVVASVMVAIFAMASPAFGGGQASDARLLDMYAVRDGDSFTVHVLASGDISQFLSDRKPSGSLYRLTLDVPALAPLDSKYDVETPFATRFQVWPMQLGGSLYSRIEMELPSEASSVVGLENESHLFVRIQHQSLTPEPAEALAVAEASDPSEAGAEPAGPAETETETETETGTETETESGASESEGAGAGAGAEAPAATGDTPDSTTRTGTTLEPESEALFVNLFPAPAADSNRQTLFNVDTEDVLTDGPIYGIRAGRFNLQPSADFSWIRGDNLLLDTVEPFVERAYLVRGRLAATLLDSEHELGFAYEARYRDFDQLVLDEKLTHVVDLSTDILLSPRSHARITNHFVHGAFESQEFDPGGEIVGSIDPFYRNHLGGLYGVDLSERLGIEAKASNNRVEFQSTESAFFDYTTSMVGGAVVYQLSPLTSLLGEYERETTPAPIQRPEAQNDADRFLFTVRGEITPLMRGTIRAGFTSVRFDNSLTPQDYTGLYAEVDLARDLGEQTALRLFAGRRTNLSAYDVNSHYVASYARAQLIAPFADRFRLTAGAFLSGNRYPVADADGILRSDDILGGSLGVAYFLTGVTYFSVDYKYDKRDSSLDIFSYRNNSIQLMVGVGFLSR